MAEETPKKETKTKSKRPTAAKRVLQNQKQALLNKSFKSRAKTTFRSFEEALEKKDASIPQKLNAVFSLLDKGVKKKIYKLNKVSRLKAKFTAKAAAK